MRIQLLIAVTFLFLIFSGCGGGGSSSTPATPTLAITSGNWDFAAASTSGTSFLIGGNVTEAGASISGAVRVINSACIAATTAVPISGSITGQTATVTSANIASQVITATLTGSANSLNGTYTVAGTGCASGDRGTFTGVVVPSISGTWTGTLISSAVGNPQVGVTVPLTEGGADATGIFALTGTAAFTGSTCFNAGTLSSISAIAGRLVDVIVKDNDGSTAEFVGTLTNPAAPTQMTGTYTVSGGLCNGDSGTGTLTKQ